MTNSSNLIGHTSMYYQRTSHKVTDAQTTARHSSIQLYEWETDEQTRCGAYLGTVGDLTLLGISLSDLDSNASSQLHKKIIVTSPDQQNNK